MKRLTQPCDKDESLAATSFLVLEKKMGDFKSVRKLYTCIFLTICHSLLILCTLRGLSSLLGQIFLQKINTDIVSSSK